MHLREYFADDDEIYLLLDIYKSHLTDQVRDMANALNIVLHFIPAGMTDLYQPLDRSVFGPFKAFSRRLFRQHNILGEPISITKSQACQDIIRAWEAVSYSSIGKAWSIYDESEEEDVGEKKKKGPKGHYSKPKPID